MENKEQKLKELFKEVYGIMTGEKYMIFNDLEMYNHIKNILEHYKNNHAVE